MYHHIKSGKCIGIPPPPPVDEKDTEGSNDTNSNDTNSNDTNSNDTNSNDTNSNDTNSNDTNSNDNNDKCEENKNMLTDDDKDEFVSYKELQVVMMDIFDKIISDEFVLLKNNSNLRYHFVKDDSEEIDEEKAYKLK
jgi:hypothetical protein